MNELTEEAMSTTLKTDLVCKAKEILKVDQENITKAITELSCEREIFIKDINDGQTAVYFAPLWYPDLLGAIKGSDYPGVAQGLVE